MAVISERFDDLGADGLPVKLGLMGGTFDPIHNGHLRIAEEMREALQLDAVLFIPAGAPVFKRDQHVTDSRVRYEQVRAAVAGNPHFDASPVEIEREGDTFTVDTLRQLRGHYPDNVEFYFIVGSDTAVTVGKWRGCKEIAELAHLAVAVGRPGSASEDELRRAVMAAAPFRLHLVRVSILEISSSDIRERLAQGKSVRYLVPDVTSARYSSHSESPALLAEAPIAESRPDAPGPSAEAPIAESRPDAPGPSAEAPIAGLRSDIPGLLAETPIVGAHSVRPASEGCMRDSASIESASISDDPLSKSFFNARKAELEQRVSPKRFKHSLGVSDTCAQLAKEYGVDVKKARLAGLLHDWDKGFNDEQARARVRELGMEGEIDPGVVETMPGVLHGMTAARALKRDFPSIPGDVLQAISRHTTAAVDMSPLDMVLYIADAIEPNRQFGRIDELRAAVGKVTLSELYFETYEYWVFLLFERRKPLHPDTITIWNAYTSQLPRKGKHGTGDGSVSGKKHKGGK